MSFTDAGGGGWRKFVRGALDAAQTVSDLIEVSKSALELASGSGDLDDLVTLGIGAAGLGLGGLPPGKKVDPNVPSGLGGLDPEDILKKATNLPTSQQKSVRSLLKRIKEHEQKLEAFKANPEAFDNKGFLRNAPNEEIRQKIINQRIRHLEQEIRTFNKNINDIIDNGGN